MLLNLIRIFVNSLILFLGLMGTLAVQDLDAQVQIKGPQDTSSWAFHDSGRIFAASKMSGSVIEYDTKGKEVRKFYVGISPTKMIIKGNRLVVAGPGRCSVIDLVANKVAGGIDIIGLDPLALFCSKVDDGIVYAVFQTESAGIKCKVFQVDIVNLKILERLAAKSWNRTPLNIAMSADGKWIAADLRSGPKPIGVVLMRANETRCKFKNIAINKSSSGQISAGPANRYWMLGEKLYSLGFESPIREFSGNSVAVHSQLDLAVSFSPKKLKFFKFSNAKLIKQLALSFYKDNNAKSSNKESEIPEKSSTEDVLIGFGTNGGPEKESQFVFVASGTICQIFDLKKAGIPLDPLLMLSTPSRVVATVGKEVSVPLSVTSRSLQDRVVYEIKRGPKGARIDGDNLAWTPPKKFMGPKHIGRHAALIIAKAAGLTDETSIEFEVQSNKIEPGFFVSGMGVDAEGQYAVVWGKEDDDGLPSVELPAEVAVIDLETRKVLLKKTFADGVKSAIIKGPNVYLIPEDGTVLHRLDRESLKSSNRIFLQKERAPEGGRAVFPYPGGHVAYAIGDELRIVDSETLQEVGRPVRYSIHGTYAPATLVSPGAVDLDSKIVDQDDGALMMLKESLGLPLLGPSKRTRYLGATTFGRQVAGDEIITAGGASVAKLMHVRYLHANPFYPVAFGIRYKNNSVSTGYEIDLMLKSYSLVDGRILDSQEFERTFQRRRLKIRSDWFFARKDKVVYAFDKQIFVIPLNRKLLQSAPLPPYFPVSKLPILSVDAPQTINLKAIGGEGKLAYRLVSEFAGLSVDSKTGLVTVDTPLLWNAYLKAFAKKRLGVRSSSPSATKKQATNGKLIEDLLGEPLPAGKFALTVPIKLTVTDERSQKDQISVFPIVIGDLTELDNFVAEMRAAEVVAKKEKKEKEARREEKAETRRKKRAAEIAPKDQLSESGAKGIESRSKQLGEIENRLKRIESSFESILLKLEALEKSK